MLPGMSLMLLVDLSKVFRFCVDSVLCHDAWACQLYKCVQHKTKRGNAKALPHWEISDLKLGCFGGLKVLLQDFRRDKD